MATMRNFKITSDKVYTNRSLAGSFSFAETDVNEITDTEIDISD
jgi:hypothetical protein